MTKVRLAAGLLIVAALWGGWVSIIPAQSRQNAPDQRVVSPIPQKAPEVLTLPKGQGALPGPLKSSLVIKEVGLSQDKPLQGVDLEARVLIQNTGERDLAGIEVLLYLDHKLVGAQTNRLVRAKGQEIIRFIFKSDRSGRLLLKATVGASDRAGEVITLEKPIEVLPPVAALSALKKPKGSPKDLEMKTAVKGPAGLFPGGPSAYEATPNLVGQFSGFTKVGSNTGVNVKIVNQGSGAAPPFSVGIFIAGPTGAAAGTPLVKARISDPLPPGAVKTLSLVFPGDLLFTSTPPKFVFKVDIDNEVPEGLTGENDNTTAPFALAPASGLQPPSLQPINPLAIGQLKVLNPSLLPGETPKLYAQVVNGPTTEWQVSYKISNVGEFIALYKKEPFPGLKSFGDYIELPFPVWPAGTTAKAGEKAQVMLSVAGADGQVIKKAAEVVLTPGSLFEGTFQLDQVTYQLTEDEITTVTLFLSYDAVHDFVLGDSGHPLWGGIGVTLQTINLAPMKTGPGNYIPVTSVQKNGNFSVKGGNLQYPKGFLPKGKGKITLIINPTVAITPKGYSLEGIQYKDQQGVITPGLGYDIGFHCCEYHYPKLVAGVALFTQTEAKSASREILIENDAVLKPTFYYFYTPPVNTTAYVCQPCKK